MSGQGAGLDALLAAFLMLALLALIGFLLAMRPAVEAPAPPRSQTEPRPQTVPREMPLPEPGRILLPPAPAPAPML